MIDPAKLLTMNPWWTDRFAIERDPHIQTWSQATFRWTPRISKRIDWNVDVLYVLRGPRQVGKTMLSKLKIRELIERSVPPRSIFYWACDLEESAEKLVELVEGYLAFSRRESGRHYLFLDEITSVRDWQKGIKALYDRGALKNCTLLLTGSHTMDLKKGAETLAGRRGDVSRLKDKLPDLVLMPMKFAEYAESRSPEIARLIKDLDMLKQETRHQLLSQIGQGIIPEEIEECHLRFREIDLYYEEYLATGGIPRPINIFVSEGVVSRDVYEVYVELLLKDVRRWGGNDRLMRSVIRRVIETLGSHVSLRKLQEGTDIASHNTVLSYLEYLREAFAINTIFRIDRSSGSPHYRGERKIHFDDPFLFHALRWWSMGLNTDPFEEALSYRSQHQNAGFLSEGVVCNHLVRLLFSFFPSAHFDPSTMLFYSQSKAKRELDFVVKLPSHFLPIEVKYQNKIRKEDGFGILDFRKGGGSAKGVLLTRTTLQKHESYLEIPVPIFLLLV